ncbi:MAG: riboflavin synthase [Pseudohongiellaceae bacterium]|jgi:riboflavin synthase
MFTGIVEAAGKIESLEQVGGDLRAVISSVEMDFSDVKTGDSICVSGVCLTALNIDDNSFSVDVSNETVSLTSFAQLQEGDKVNLEKAMQPQSRFGGHIVSGHVDGLAELVSRTQDGRSERLVFSTSSELHKYIAAKGSVCLEGISLTVNQVDGLQFGVNVIPHTAEKTTLDLLQVGSKVNLEVDIISRYLERLLVEKKDGMGHEVAAGITLDKLISSGFVDKA